MDHRTGARGKARAARQKDMNDNRPAADSWPIDPARSPAPGSISVCMVCRNEADRLPAALESVAWADEVLVMDLESTDGSGDVAARAGARVISRAPHPVVEPLRDELGEHATGAWILALDPDERITPGLAAELRRAAQRDDIDAVVIPRMNYDLGYPPTSPVHRYEPQLRMYRRSAVRWPTFPNTLPSVPEDRKYIIERRDSMVMIHDRARTVPEILDRVVRYAPAQAQAMVDAGQTFTAGAMLKALTFESYKQFVWAKAWRDGVPGFFRASTLVAFKMYVWAAFWQLSGRGRTRQDDQTMRNVGAVAETGRSMLRVARFIFRLARRVSGRP